MVANFLADLHQTAPHAGGMAYAFSDGNKGCRGWVQFIIRSDQLLEIHRLWTLQPGRGNGSHMLKTVCELADRHGVELLLKATPFGRKPHRMTADGLADWYRRHGFIGDRKKLVRKPMVVTVRVSAG